MTLKSMKWLFSGVGASIVAAVLAYWLGNPAETVGIEQTINGNGNTQIIENSGTIDNDTQN